MQQFPSLDISHPSDACACSSIFLSLYTPSFRFSPSELLSFAQFDALDRFIFLPRSSQCALIRPSSPFISFGFTRPFSVLETLPRSKASRSPMGPQCDSLALSEPFVSAPSSPTMSLSSLICSLSHSFFEWFSSCGTFLVPPQIFFFNKDGLPRHLARS